MTLEEQQHEAQAQPPQPIYVHNSQDAELPSLMVEVVEHSGDFEKSRVTLQAKGRDLDEAGRGILFLLQQALPSVRGQEGKK